MGYAVGVPADRFTLRGDMPQLVGEASELQLRGVPDALEVQDFPKHEQITRLQLERVDQSCGEVAGWIYKSSCGRFEALVIND